MTWKFESSHIAQTGYASSILVPCSFNKPIAQLGRATLLKCFLGKKINRNYYLAVNPCVIGSNPIRFIENYRFVDQLAESYALGAYQCGFESHRIDKKT